MKTKFSFSTLAAIAISFTLCAQSNSNTLKIAVVGNSNMSQQQVSQSEVLYFNPGGSDSLDFIDMSGFYSPNHDSVVSPFTLTADGRTVDMFDNRPELTGFTSINLGFKSEYTATISVTAIPDTTLQIGYAWLEQVYSGTIINLLNDTATITIPANSNWSAGYILHTGPAIVKTVTDVTCFGGTNGSIDVLNPNCSNWHLDIYQGASLLFTSCVHNPDTVINGLVSGNYTVVSHIGNGLADSSLVNVNSAPQLIASFTASTYSTTAGSPVVFTNTSSSGVNYLWDFGDADTSNLVDPTHTYANVNTYAVTLLITNSNGCQASFTDTIDVVTGPPLRYYQSQNREDENNNNNSTQRNTEELLTVTSSHQNLSIKTNSEEIISFVQVLNVNGQLISEEQVNASNTEIKVPAKGIYIVRMQFTNGKVISRKLIITE